MTDRAIDLAPPPTLSAAEKLRIALEMAELGIEMKRRSLERDDPGASPDVIEERLHAWLAAKP